eukprot:scaffold45318_cov64-Phaeocystis_antarctica.AAC.5
MPAEAIIKLASGSKSMFTPATRAVMHSACCSARNPPCSAARLLEQAVSYDTHGPCSPSAKESRPTTTEHVEAVAAYTLRPAALRRRTAEYSLAQTPTNTPVALPIKLSLRRPPMCKAS